MKFRVSPVKSGLDATLNFDQLQLILPDSAEPLDEQYVRTPSGVVVLRQNFTTVVWPGGSHFTGIVTVNVGAPILRVTISGLKPSSGDAFASLGTVGSESFTVYSCAPLIEPGAGATQVVNYIALCSK